MTDVLVPLYPTVDRVPAFLLDEDQTAILSRTGPVRMPAATPAPARPAARHTAAAVRPPRTADTAGTAIQWTPDLIFLCGLLSGVSLALIIAGLILWGCGVQA